MRLVIATANAGKLKEIRHILAYLPIEIVSLADYPGIPEPEENGTTFAENAIIKALHAMRHTGELSIADDSGLEVDALNGEPGIRSSRYAGPGASDAHRNALLLEKLEGVPDERRTARFRCVAALAGPDGEVETFDGVCEGQIAYEPRGEHGFGYDPLFYVPDFGKTMAELPDEVKNQISHRARAMSALGEALNRRLDTNSSSASSA